jgi:hypothetical protein
MQKGIASGDFGPSTRAARRSNIFARYFGGRVHGLALPQSIERIARDRFGMSIVEEHGGEIVADPSSTGGSQLELPFDE